MSEMGKITEIQPEDGLGWIEMPDGSRVRFGGTACKGFVPSIGMYVRVLGTKPGFRGVLKATELEHVKAGAASAEAASAPGAPRQFLHTVQASGVRADDVLLQLLGLADVSDPMFADLESLHVELQPTLASELGCHNPWFYAIAMDGGGNAYGLYTHPMVANYAHDPWLFWDHELDRVRYVAETTGELLLGLLANAAESGVDATVVARARIAFVKLGMVGDAGAPIAEAKAEWLPPEDDELRPLAEYLAEQDVAEMERGVAAYAWRKQDPEAIASLASLYKAWEWKPPEG